MVGGAQWRGDGTTSTSRVWARFCARIRREGVLFIGLLGSLTCMTETLSRSVVGFERASILIWFGEDFFAWGWAALVLRRGLHGEDDDGSSSSGHWASPGPHTGCAAPRAGEEAGPGLGHVKIKNKGGKEEAGQAGLGFQLGFDPLPNRN
jgi:hypothetical protein